MIAVQRAFALRKTLSNCAHPIRSDNDERDFSIIWVLALFGQDEMQLALDGHLHNPHV